VTTVTAVIAVTTVTAVTAVTTVTTVTTVTGPARTPPRTARHVNRTAPAHSPRQGPIHPRASSARKAMKAGAASRAGLRSSRVT
jgi:hypothetical protein